MNVPAMSATPTQLATPTSKKSPLDVLIGDGDEEIEDTIGLGYVIPPTGENCGRGTAEVDGMVGIPFNAVGVDGNDDGDFEDEGDNPGEGDIATDVAAGYSDLLIKFEDVYGAPGGMTGGTARALTAAQKLLADAIEDGRTGASLTPLENAVTRAQEAHDKARAAFTDASAGPIYQAGVAEWMAKSVVTKSVSDYNKAVVKANDARVDLDVLEYADYVPLGGGPEYRPRGRADHRRVHL